MPVGCRACRGLPRCRGAQGRALLRHLEAGATGPTRGSATTPTQSWDGYLDDFRVYNRFLSQEEIETLYACRGNDWIIDGLINWWPMNEGSEGSTVSSLIDVVGGFDLTVVNSTPTYGYSAGLIQRRTNL